MALERTFQWDPFGELAHIQRRLTNMLERRGLPRLQRWLQAAEYPPVNVYVTETDVVVAVELPGVSPDDIDISVVSGVLTIKGRRDPVEQEGAAWYRRERPVGEFSRSVALPEPVDNSKASAGCNKGILSVVLPRAEEAKPRKIKVSDD